jgi:hypothetical protein
MRVSLKFVPQDVWIGVFWRKTELEYILGGVLYEMFICVLPCFPIHLSWTRSVLS